MSYKNWFEEKQSAWLYRIVTQAEPDPHKSTLFAELADAAESQARIWEKELVKDDGQPPPFHPSLRARLVAQLIQALGPRSVRPILASMKVRGMSVYLGAPLSDGRPMPTFGSEVGGRHKGVEIGGNLRAAVFGANDGLVSNAALIMGVAGATSDLHVVYLSGIAGLLAGAFSMAAGEYVSVSSQRELFEYQIGLEREELEEYPLEEQEELALIYRARGLSKEKAHDVAAELMKDPVQALNTLSREELGLNPAELGSPWGAAGSSFLSFAAGGVVPLVPFLFGNSGQVMDLVVVITGFALFSVGSTLSLFTGKNAWRSGMRMVLIGGGAGAITFLGGRLLGGGLP
jgi:VIT1/CCC1 family predicted Fe2+/Mn2+ transporter